MLYKIYVYFFGGGKAEGAGNMKELLGGKGSGLAEITNSRPAPSKEKEGFVFISYTKEDRNFAELVQLHLRHQGFKEWMDQSRLNGGDTWQSKIEQGLREAVAVVVVMSKKASLSQWVTYEWSFARGLGKKVIPLTLEPMDIPEPLKEVQSLNFKNSNIVRPWEELFKALKD